MSPKGGEVSAVPHSGAGDRDEFWQGALVEKCSQVDGGGEFSSSHFSSCFGPSEFEFPALHQLCPLVSCLLVHPW